MKCPHCNFTWNRLDICLTLPIHDCDKFTEKPLTKKEKNEKRLAWLSKRPFVGDQLHFLIFSWFAQEFTHECECQSYASKMNAWGVAGCHRRIDRITRKLLVEGRRRGLLASKVPGVGWIKRRAAKIICVWLVRLAVYRAENHDSVFVK
jgi:hypothetical protein